MELITKDYFYTLVPKEVKWSTYRVRLFDFEISKNFYCLNYVLIDNTIPAAYFSNLELLVVPNNYELSEERVELLKTERLTIDTWKIEDIDYRGDCILTRNEMSRSPHVISVGYRTKINNIGPRAFTIKSTVDNEFKKEFVQLIENPEKYSSYKILVCNDCVRDVVNPRDIHVNYIYNIIYLIINLKYIK